MDKKSSQEKITKYLKQVSDYHPGVEWMAIVDSTGQVMAEVRLEKSRQDNIWDRIYNLSVEISSIASQLGYSNTIRITIDDVQSRKIALFPIDCIDGVLIADMSTQVKFALFYLDVSRMLNSICSSYEDQS